MYVSSYWPWLKVDLGRSMRFESINIMTAFCVSDIIYALSRRKRQVDCWAEYPDVG
jgi:hypothetical protein